MENYHSSVTELWQRFTKSHPEYLNTNYKAWHFCDNEKCANELAELVKKGIKKATASLLYWYEKGEEQMPKKDEINIVTDWSGIAHCVIKTNKISILPFRKVTAEMAYTEGEGDRSLEYWRNGHINFFTRDLKSENIIFTEDLAIVFEEFEMIYE